MAQSYRQHRGDDSSMLRARLPKPVASAVGIGFLVGGGITNFTDAQVRDRLESRRRWDARSHLRHALVDRSRKPLTTAGQQHRTPSLISQHQLLGNGIKPWRASTSRVPRCSHTSSVRRLKHYALAGDKFNVSGIRNDDNVAEIRGWRVAYHKNGLMMDGAACTHTAQHRMFTPTGQSGSEGKQLHNWGVRVNLGFEFRRAHLPLEIHGAMVRRRADRVVRQHRPRLEEQRPRCRRVLPRESGSRSAAFRSQAATRISMARLCAQAMPPTTDRFSGEAGCVPHRATDEIFGPQEKMPYRGTFSPIEQRDSRCHQLLPSIHGWGDAELEASWVNVAAPHAGAIATPDSRRALTPMRGMSQDRHLRQ